MRSLAPLPASALAGALRWTVAHPDAPAWAWWHAYDTERVYLSLKPYGALYTNRDPIGVTQRASKFRYSPRTDIRKACL